MKKATIGLLGLSLAAGSVQAGVPVYRNDRLDLGAVAIIDGSGGRYFADVELLAQDDGSLRVVSAKRRPLAPVDTAEVTVYASGDSLQASVRATGILSNPCVALEKPAVSRAGDVFTVVLAETVQAPGEVCVTIAATTPFDVSVPLPLDGLGSGDYEVRVNGVTSDFTLELPQS